MRPAEAEERFRNIKIIFENLVKETEKRTGPIHECEDCGRLIHEGPCPHCEVNH